MSLDCRHAVDRLVVFAADMHAALADLLLPADCAGCGDAAGPGGICPACADVLTLRPGPARPTPAPYGLPPCVAVGAYEGSLREMILAYKERGRRGLAAALGDALAAAVMAGSDASHPVASVLVPVPCTPAAARARHGDHMLRLARRAARSLRRRGWPAAVATPLRARSRADSAGLGRADRERQALGSFAVRPRPVAPLRHRVDAGALVVVLDDVLTTGATIAAVARHLFAAGVPVAYGATLAATRLRGRAGDDHRLTRHSTEGPDPAIPR